MNTNALRKLDSKVSRTPLRRFAFGIACGGVGALGMWLISTLGHNENYGLGLTWQFAVTWVLMLGIINLAVKHEKT